MPKDRILNNKKALKLIEEAICVRIDADEVTYPVVDMEDQCITLQDAGGNYTLIPYVGNETVAIINNGTELRFKKDDGEWVDLMPLFPKKLI